MAFSFNIGNVIGIILNYWYFIVIGILGIYILSSLSKKRKIEYYDQVKENKKIWAYELEWNPSEFTEIIHRNNRYKIYGERFIGRVELNVEPPKERQDREFTEKEIANYKLEKIKAKLKGLQEPEIIIHKFLVKSKNFMNFFWHGEYGIIAVEPNDFYPLKKGNKIRLHDSLRLMYEKGMLIPLRPNMIDFVSEETERVMKDLEISGRGQQQKDFSRIRSDYAHQEVMKEKDIEAEKEKEKAKRFS